MVTKSLPFEHQTTHKNCHCVRQLTISRDLWCNHKLQALVYDILPSTTAVFSYTIQSRKLSANEQFVGSQTVVSLLHTTQIISEVCFITDHVAYASSPPPPPKKKSFELRWHSSFFSPGVDASHVYVHAWALGCFHSLISTQTFRRALTMSMDSCAEKKSASSVASPNLAEFGERCQKATLRMWCNQSQHWLEEGCHKLMLGDSRRASCNTPQPWLRLKRKEYDWVQLNHKRHL